MRVQYHHWLLSLLQLMDAYVHIGKCTTTDREVAIKLEEISVNKSDTLTTEWSILQELENIVGVPRPFAFDDSGNYRYLVESRTGCSLDKWLDFCGGQFSDGTIGRIGDQAIRRLQQIHERGIIHNDVKPSNIAIGGFWHLPLYRGL